MLTNTHLKDNFAYKSKVLFLDFVVLHPANITDPYSNSFESLKQLTLVPE